MAPTVLKLLNGSNMINVSNDENMDELQTIWRVSTKAKQALEHGSRLENRSWRRWFLSIQKRIKRQPKTTIIDLEIQYKRNMLLQQRKQCQQLLMKQSGTVVTTTNLPVLVDDPHQSPLLKQTIPLITTSNDDPGPTWLGETSTLTTSDSHPAMYVSYDEPNSLAVQYNTLQYRFDPTPTTVPSSAAVQPNFNENPKTQKHRFRRPLPAMNADGNEKTKCDDCSTSFTPLWRRYQNKTLCNACALYWKLHNSPRPGHLITSMTQRSHSNHNNHTLLDYPQCSNCGTNQTTLWRRNKLDDLPLCNACSLYAKVHKETRPLSMKTNVIKKRQRLY